jgi:hypothetical protein
MKRERIGLAALVLAAGMGACAATAPPEKASPAEQPAIPDAGELGAIASLAIKTLSEHLSVSPRDVRIVSITPIEWRDSSLGCAKPDRGYMQVITPGHQAIGEYLGRSYSIHMAGKRAFVCEPMAGGGKGEKEMNIEPLVKVFSKEELQQLARENLAQRLGVALDQITVARTKSVEWTDESLGCPQPSERYSRRRSKGYVFELKYRDTAYLYHSDLRRVLPCPPIEKG